MIDNFDPSTEMRYKRLKITKLDLISTKCSNDKTQRKHQ